MLPLASTYDLAGASNDCPPWQGKPHRSILICSHPRSGSTFLGEALHFAGGLGCPLEYMHRGFRPVLAKRWEAPDINSYIDALHRYRTDANGTLSIKLFWQDVEEVAHERSPSLFAPVGLNPPGSLNADDYRAFHGLLESMFPNPTFVYLERRDRVRQAVSAVVAAQTAIWRSIPQMGRQEPLQISEYDYDRILGMVAFADYSHDHWRNFFDAAKVEPYCISYEEMAKDHSPAVGNLLKWLGSLAGVPEPRMRRQSDDRSEAMVLRFLRDHASRSAESPMRDGESPTRA
jgi:LPS sulfotransferase NodH